MHKEFTFEVHGKQRKGIITDTNYKRGKRYKGAFKAIYGADIMFRIGSEEHDIYLQKNRFPNITIKLVLEITHVYIHELMVKHPEIRVFNNNKSKINKLLNDSINIDLG